MSVRSKQSLVAMIASEQSRVESEVTKPSGRGGQVCIDVEEECSLMNGRSGMQSVRLGRWRWMDDGCVK